MSRHIGSRRTEIVFVTRHLVKIVRYYRGPSERIYNATPASWARLGRITAGRNVEQSHIDGDRYSWIRRRRDKLAGVRPCPL